MSRVRVNWTRQLIGAMRRQCPHEYGEVDAQLSAKTAKAFADAGPLQWPDAEHHIELCEVARNVLGSGPFRESVVVACTGAGQSPMFGSIARGFMGLFGVNPPALVRASVRVWGLVFDDMGAATFEDDGACVVVRQLPPLLRTHTAFVWGVTGGYDACIRFANHEGHAEFDDHELAQGVVRYDLRWQARSAA